jgi:hypothetical protein
MTTNPCLVGLDFDAVRECYLFIITLILLVCGNEGIGSDNAMRKKEVWMQSNKSEISHVSSEFPME